MQRMIRLLAALLVSLLLMLALATTRPLLAMEQNAVNPTARHSGPGAIIVVTTTTLNINADGQCSLVEAIINANDNDATHPDCAAGSGADTIELAANATYEATMVYNVAGGPNALPSILSEVTINGHDAILQRSDAGGTPLMRLMRVGGSGTLTINELTVRNGRLDGQPGGGGILNNGGELTLNDCTFEHNTVVNYGGGGATNFYGTMRVTDSVFRENHADSPISAGGGILHWATANDATLFVTNSQFISNTVAGGGGGIASLVSLGNNVRTTIAGSTFTGNVDSEGDYGGGAIWMNMNGIGSTSIVTVTHSLFTNNSTAAKGGAILHLATHFTDATSILMVSDSVVSGNRAVGTEPGSGHGGGIATLAGENLISDSTIRDNLASGGDAVPASGNGGGLYNQGQTTLLRTTVSNNRATGSGSTESGQGGGIVHLDLDDNITESIALTVANSTISGNEATNSNPQTVDGGAGGGFSVRGIGAVPVGLTVINSTIADNSASRTGGGVSTFNLSSANPVEVVSVNSIVGDNSAPANPSCDIGSQSISTSQGYNLEDGNTCNFTQPSDLPNTNPQLAPLGDYGGPTWTHMLMPVSPAINAANDATCAAPPVGGIDQRDYGRPQVECDIGAYERADPSAVTLDSLTAKKSDLPFVKLALAGFAVWGVVALLFRRR